MKQIAPDLSRFVKERAYAVKDANVHAQLKQLRAVARAANAMCKFEYGVHPGMTIDIRKIEKVVKALKEAGLQ